MASTAENVAARGMRVAIVARRAPLPPFSGIGLIVHNITVRLARDHEVQVFLTDDDIPAGPVLDSLPLHACGKSGYSDSGARVETGTFRNAIARFYGVTLEREQWLARQLAAFAPDVVLGYGYDVAPFLDGVRDRYAVVGDVIDSEILYLWRQLRRGRVSVTTLKHLLMSLRLARRMLGRFDALVTVANEDSRNIARIAGHDDVATIPNGVDCDYYSPQAGIAAVPGRIIFTGSMSWEPNVQAVDWFLSGCWQQIAGARPDATFVIVGKGLTAEQRSRFERYPGVTAVGFVDDIRPHLLAAQVSVAPMISGSGIKNKILEAWATSRAVVATPTAARGLENGEDCFIVAAEPARFARAVIELLEDAGLRTRLGMAGRVLAVSRYSWDAAASDCAQVLARAARGSASRRR